MASTSRFWYASLQILETRFLSLAATSSERESDVGGRVVSFRFLFSSSWAANDAGT